MRCFSISQGMLVIAPLAGDFAALRASVHDPHSVPLSLLTGLLPLADASIIGLYLLARRYRISLRRHQEKGNGAGVIAFVAFTSLSLVILLIACLVATEPDSDWLGTALDPVGQWLISLGYGLRDLETPFFEIFVVPFCVAAVLSGPPLMLGLELGWPANRYELVIDRPWDPSIAPAGAPPDGPMP